MALSTALVVISLATALKDVIELAQNIRDAFQRVPQNYRTASNLASDILKTAEQMQILYGDKIDIFERATDLRCSVDHLRQEMSVVHERCIRLIPPVTERKRDRFKIAIYSFWNRDKVDSIIFELKSHMDNCYKQFLLLSSIRIEATVNHIAHILNTQLEDQSRSRNPRNNFGPSQPRLFQFSQSHTIGMTWIQDSIPSHELSHAYLRRELGSTEKALRRLTIKLSHNSLLSFQVLPLKLSWSLHNAVVSDDEHHQQMVIKVFQLQALIANGDESSISTISYMISAISANLGDSRMSEDALAVRRLGVDFWRQIISVFPSENANAHLADHLTNLAICLQNTGDSDSAYSVNQEATALTQRLLDRVKSPQLLEVIARNLSLQAKNQLRSTDGIEQAKRALAALQKSFEIQGVHVDSPPQSLSGTDALRQHTMTDIATNGIPFWISRNSLFTYSSILLDLSTLQESQGKISDALLTRKQALSVLLHTHLDYPNSRRLLDKIAFTLASLCGDTYRALNSISDNLEYARASVDMYGKLVPKDPSRYVISLSLALWTYRQILVSAGKPRDADAVHTKMISLAGLASQRYSDIHLPSEVEGDYHLHLAVSYQLARRLPDAIYAAQNAVRQFSALQYVEPHRSPFKHVKALSVLTTILCTSHQYTLVLNEGYRALDLVDRSMGQLTRNGAFVGQYLTLLENIMEALHKSSDPNSLQKANRIMARYDALMASNKNWNLSFVSIPATYMEILTTNQMPDTAIQYARNFLRKSVNANDHLKDAKIVYPYLQCLKAWSDTLEAQGNTEGSLKCNAEAIKFIQKYCNQNDNPLICNLCRGIMCKKVYLLWHAGRYEEALTSSQILVDLYLEDDRESGITALHCLGMSQVHSCTPHDAVSTFTEAMQLCRSEISQGRTYAQSWLFLSLVGLSGLSDALFDIGCVDDSLLRMDEARKAIEETIHSLNMFIASKNARLLFASGEYGKAKELVDEVITYERGLCAANKFAFRQLSKTLRFAGMVFCSVGQHDKGVAALAELAGCMNQFSASNPTFANEVQFVLYAETKRGMWKLILESAKSCTGCTHQDAAIFEKDITQNSSSHTM